MTREEIARAAKARKLADTLHAVGISSDSARRMTTLEWSAVATCAGCNPPHSEDTRNAVYLLLEEMAAPKRITVREFRDRVSAMVEAESEMEMARR